MQQDCVQAQFIGRYKKQIMTGPTGSFRSTFSEGHGETKLTVSLRLDIQCLVLTCINYSTYISAHILHMFSFTLLHIIKDTFQLGVHECTLVSLFPLLQLVSQIKS